MNTISVITICFNNLAEIQKTCRSVDAQSHLPDEHWVVNGSDQPEIANWLLQTTQPAYRKWINERDDGIADAFNIGITRSTGQIIHLLNSGDQYASNGVLAAVEQTFVEHPGAGWLSGKIALLRGGKTVVVGKPFDKTKLYRGMRSVSHPTWFVKREVYTRAGLYDGNYAIAMDYDMMCRIARESYVFLDKLLVEFDVTGISSSQYHRSLQENKKIYVSHFGSSAMLNIWQVRLKILHFLLGSRMGRSLFALKKRLGLENW